MIINAATFDSSGGYGRLACDVLSVLGERVKGINAFSPLPKHLERYNTTKRANLAVIPPQQQTSAPAVFTMWESDTLPKNIVANLNTRKLVIVPCEHNLKAFKSSGVKSKVVVCNPGITPHYVFPPTCNPFTFLHVAADHGIPERKRSADIITAFKEAFPTESMVRLLIKKTPSCTKLVNFDKRIEIITNSLPQNKLNDLYQSAHIGVFLSGMEAWGYPHMELMSIGRPVIAPFYGGPAEYLTATNAYMLPFSLVRVPKNHFNRVGYTAQTNTKHVVQWMRFCYDNKEDVVQKGVMAYRKSLQFTMNKMQVTLNKIIDENPELFKIS